MSVLVFALALPPILPAAPPKEPLKLKEGPTFKGHTFDVACVAVTADGKLLASGGGDTHGGELKLWEAATAKEIGSFPGYTDSLFALAFSADGKCRLGSERWQESRLVVSGPTFPLATAPPIQHNEIHKIARPLSGGPHEDPQDSRHRPGHHQQRRCPPRRH